VTRPALIFVTHRPPWPLDNGARIRSARLAQGLARSFALTLVTFADGPVYDETRASREQLQALIPDADIVLVPYGRAHPRGVRRDAWRPRSVTWGTYATPTLRAALARLATEQAQAILHLDGPGAALAGLGLAPGRTAFAPHNVEHRIVGGLARSARISHRPFLELEARKIEREERRCWRAADVCVAVSELDAKVMQAGGARRVEVCPNGADPHDPLPPPPAVAGRPLRLLFVGSGAYPPYERGLAWFVRQVLPRLRSLGAVAFDVVGERPAASLPADGVRYHGRVPDVQPFDAAADALVVPVFEGSGTRLKIIEAAQLGRPVISTSLGAEGLPVLPGRDYARAESVAEWVAAVAALSRGELAGLVPAARRTLADFTWPRIAAALADAYRGLVPPP
jgi:hypothetical protein